MHHDLKLLAGFWEPKIDGRKPWEIRECYDRIFSEGDTVTFSEVIFTPNGVFPEPTGRVFGPVTITYVLVGGGYLPNDRCIFTHTMPA